jgi:hypothetical protein
MPPDWVLIPAAGIIGPSPRSAGERQLRLVVAAGDDGTMAAPSPDALTVRLADHHGLAAGWPTQTGPGPLPSHAADKHALDLALSAGRHAVERARLAGARRLVANATAAARQAPPTRLATSPVCVYRGLALLGPEIAVLAGICLSAAQIGLPVAPVGIAARVAARLAAGMNPSVRMWIDLPDATPGHR